MGFLFRRRARLPKVAVYGSEDEKWSAALAAVEDTFEQGLPVLVIAHFKDSLKEAARRLDATELPWVGYEQLPEGPPSASLVSLVPASAFAWT